MDEFQFFDGAINTPKGFYAAGVSCGIKKTKDLDLSLVVSDPPAISTGVFTTNLVKGHSLQRTMNIIGKAPTVGIIINSGNANACVGLQGEKDAESIAKALSECLSCNPENILTASTGVIGTPLPMNLVNHGIYKAVSSLSQEVESGHLAELAMLTTDTTPKERSISIMAGDKPVIISGMAKGSGMIHPNMATMIGIITTDCNVTEKILNKVLKQIVNKTFNRISVDGDTSVCDMVVMMANGCAENNIIDSCESRDYRKFVRAMEILCTDLAKSIASDGEGATKLIEITVNGAPTEIDAHKITESIACSPLVKTAFFGEDANWGRIITAAGYSGANFDVNSCSVNIGSVTVFNNGTANPFDEEFMKEILKEKDIKVTLNLDQGKYSDTMWTCDFSYDYVKINGSYRT